MILLRMRKELTFTKCYHVIAITSRYYHKRKHDADGWQNILEQYQLTLSFSYCAEIGVRLNHSKHRNGKK